MLSGETRPALAACYAQERSKGGEGREMRTIRRERPVKQAEKEKELVLDSLFPLSGKKKRGKRRGGEVCLQEG